MRSVPSTNEYWEKDFPRILELNKKGLSTIELELELVEKYDETFGTLMFAPSCEKLRMSPTNPCCGHYVIETFGNRAFCTKEEIGQGVSSEKIPDECPFSVLNQYSAGGCSE